MVKSDRENAEFLYSIIKQLDTRFVSLPALLLSLMLQKTVNIIRQVDWKQVAESNHMTKDHAARMRFHRLRKEFDGVGFVPRRRTQVERAAPPKTKSNKRKKLTDNPSDDEESPLDQFRHPHHTKEEIELLKKFKREEDSSQNVLKTGMKENVDNKADQDAQIKVEQHGKAMGDIETVVEVFANSGSMLANEGFIESGVAKGKFVYDPMSSTVKDEPL